MGMVEIVLWVVLPFSSIAIFLMGLIWQYGNKESYATGFKKDCCTFVGFITIVTGIVSFFLLYGKGNFFWIWNLICFKAEYQNIIVSPILFKIHVMSFCSLLLILPFTSFIKLFNLSYLINLLYLLVGSGKRMIFGSYRGIGFRVTNRTKTQPVKEY
ncbi:respiratory nitrate reductase subunit gamma [Aquibacillus kalidii]|uniref:respiratory nitrate reductase subunit gamma n=1 Tax=Aquibacillus kalidii TaxID=2762597 RepID=UPI001644A4F7|nr:respiratory nitrate reductase subunit gamma [Aquibacillus kalidii]